MPTYKFDFAAERPEDFAKTIVSGRLVPVHFNDVFQSEMSFDGSGILEMDLPEEVIDKLDQGLAKVCLVLKYIRKDKDQKTYEQELIAINVTDKDDWSASELIGKL